MLAASRFVLPEQRELYRLMKEEEKLVDRPDIDEDEFGEMCFRIYDSTQYDYTINVMCFVPKKGNFGPFEEARYVVREIDTHESGSS